MPGVGRGFGDNGKGFDIERRSDGDKCLVESESENERNKGKGCRGGFLRLQSCPLLYIYKIPLTRSYLPTVVTGSPIAIPQCSGTIFQRVHIVANVIHPCPTYATTSSSRS